MPENKSKPDGSKTTQETLGSSFTIEDLERIKSWIDRYYFSMKILECDLYIITRKKFNLSVAIDFSDIFEHCFPFADFFRSIQSMEFHSQKDLILRRELGRYGLFLLFNKIYNVPLLFLPPYLSEAMDFFDRFATISEYEEATDIEIYKETDSKSKKAYVYEALKDIDKVDLHNFSEFLAKLNEVAPDLIFITSPHFRDGIGLYTELIKDKIKPFSNQINEDLIEPVPKDYERKRSKYIQALCDIRSQDNQNIEFLVTRARPIEEKWLANKRDAKSLQYILMLNEKLKNNIIFLTTLSNHLLSLSDNDLFIKQFDERTFYIIRDTENLYFVLLELNNFLLNRNQNLDNYALEDFYEYINDKIKLLEKYKEDIDLNMNMAWNVGGDPLDDLIHGTIDKIDIIKGHEAIGLLSILQSLEENDQSFLGHLQRLRKLDLDTEKIAILNFLNKKLRDREFSDFFKSQKALLGRQFADSLDDFNKLIDRGIEKSRELAIKRIGISKDLEIVILAFVENGNAKELIELFKKEGNFFIKGGELRKFGEDSYALINKNMNKFIFIKINERVEVFFVDLQYLYLWLENVINKLIKTKSFAEDDENVYILLKRDLIKPIRQIKLYLKTKILNDLDQLERRID